MTTQPQDDLTAERAAKLYSLLHASISHDYVCGPDDIKAIRKMEIVDKALIMAALQTARQEAMREVRDYALACAAERKKQAFELTKTVLNDPRAVWLGCKASEAERIAEWIDRLASEGG